MAPSAVTWADDGWEICNDHGFVYKRRRRNRLEEEGPPPARLPEDDPEAALRRHRRAERKRCLLNLRDKYRRELEQWDGLSASLRVLTEAPSASSSAAAPPPSRQEPSPAQPGPCPQLIEDIVLQVEAQDAILRKLSELCDYAEAECKAREERLVQSIIDLPIWRSPRDLIAALTD